MPVISTGKHGWIPHFTGRVCPQLCLARSQVPHVQQSQTIWQLLLEGSSCDHYFPLSFTTLKMKLS